MSTDCLDAAYLFDSADLLACQFDRESLRIRAMSPSLARAVGGASSEEWTGKYLINLFSPESYVDIERLITEGPFSEGLECRLASQEGLAFSVVVVVDKGFYDAGAVFSTLICVPVPDRRISIKRLHDQAEEAAEQAETLGGLMRLIVHDVKGSLQVILGSLELIQLKGSATSESAQRDLLRVDRAARSMNALLTEISKYTRIDIDEYPAEMTDMNALIDEVIGEFLEDAGSKASIRRTTTIPRLVCERFLVAELFYNLIDNAIKYSGNAAATIDIGSRAEGGRLTFYVRDFGVGIRFSDISSVVLPLKRADHRKLNMGATGMGLSQAKKIAERHGGTLWLESVVDSGTTVWFSLGDPL